MGGIAKAIGGGSKPSAPKPAPLAAPKTEDVEGREDIDKKRRKLASRRRRAPTSLQEPASIIKTLLGQ